MSDNPMTDFASCMSLFSKSSRVSFSIFSFFRASNNLFAVNSPCSDMSLDFIKFFTLSSFIAGSILNDAILSCKEVGVISERTEHLLHAVRTYRNLIHPGRIIRLKETVNEDSAIIAEALVNTIIGEISANRKEKYGYTAEQVVTQIVRDPSKVAILKHIIRETNDFERERLLLSIIPQQYLRLLNIGEQTSDPVLSALSSSYYEVYLSVKEEVKEKVAKKIVQVIKEESQMVVNIYENFFFNIDYLEHLSDSDRQLVKEHLLARLVKEPSNSLLSAISGIGTYLIPNEIYLWISPIIKQHVEESSELISNAKYYIDNEFSFTFSEDKQKKLIDLLESSINNYKQKELVKEAEKIEEILAYVTSPV